MPQESLQKLYDTVSQTHDIGDFDTFVKKMQDADSRQKFYGAVSDAYDLGDFETFESKVQVEEKPGLLGAIGERLKPTEADPAGALEVLVNAFGALESGLASFLPTRSGEKVGQEETTAEAIERGKTMGEALTEKEQEELGYALSAFGEGQAPSPKEAREVGSLGASLIGDPFNLILPLAGIAKYIKLGKTAEATKAIEEVSKLVKQTENIDEVVKSLGKTPEESVLKQILGDIKEGKTPEQIIAKTAKENIDVGKLPDVKGKRGVIEPEDLEKAKVNPEALPEFGGEKIRKRTPIQKGQEPLPQEVGSGKARKRRVASSKQKGEEPKPGVEVKGGGGEKAETSGVVQKAQVKPQAEKSVAQKAGEKEFIKTEAKQGRKVAKLTRAQKKERLAEKVERGELEGDLFAETAKQKQTSLLEGVPKKKVRRAKGREKVRTAIENDPNLKLKDSEVDRIFGKERAETAKLKKQIGGGKASLDDVSLQLQEAGIIEKAPQGYNAEYLENLLREDAVTAAKRQQTLEKQAEKVYGETAKETPKVAERPTPPSPKGKTDKLTYDELNVGDEFTINGEKFEVTGKKVEGGKTVGIKLKDRKNYEQDLGDFETGVEFDKGSLTKAPATKSGKEYAKGIVEAVKKDITSKASGITPDPYRNIKQFITENNLQLTDDEIKTLNAFAKKTLRGSGTAAEKQAVIERYAAHQVEARARMSAPPPTEQEVNKVVKETIQPEAEKAVEEANKVIDERAARHEELRQTLKEAKPLRGEQEKIYSKERAQRFARFREKGEKVSGEAGHYVQRSQLAGEHTKVEFEALRDKLDQPKIDALFDDIKFSDLRSGDQITAGKGLAKMLEGKVPTKGEIAHLEDVFGKDLTKELLDKRSMFQRFKDAALELANVPRSLMASFDLSAPFRQGIFVATRHPKIFFSNFKGMFKSFGSERAYQGLLSEIHARPTFDLMKKNKLAITELGSLTSREERFMSNFAERIPVAGRVVRASGRAYTGFLDKVRADLFDYMFQYGKRIGALDDPGYLKDAAKFINAATGRGTLGALERAAVPLNTFFFSPRLMASRIQLLNPRYYVKLQPAVRKEALKSLLSFAGMGLTVSAIAKLGGAEVETDPRNANFAKLKFGNTRYDPLGGFQQPIRAAAQILSGKIISSTTGKEITLGEGYKPLTRLDIGTRFFEMKEAPVVSFATSLLKGRTSIGEKVDVPTEVANRFIPMVAQDMVDLYKERGLEGIPLASPVIFGVSVQTYGGVNSWGLSGKDYPKLNKELDRLNTSMGFPGTSAFGVELSNKEYKEYKRKGGKAIADSLTDLMKSDGYKKSDDKRKVQLIESRVDYIKEKVKTKLFSYKEKEKYYEEREKRRSQ